ncbi:21095_t:CDS:2 [Cetraspora pellucida]|uniref:21095_t:CDS:1 n=1 Tax=Cetraspora pellucida TaxID=1433469 RepID=A0A9N9JIH9_9GLOM|nr:21095_t:CDS:2 [Cetraspora pellucida]
MSKILPHIDPGTLDCIIYHKDCSDGFGAAYSAWKRLGNNAVYHAAQHSTPPPQDIQDKRIGIFDFSYPKTTLKELKKQAKIIAVVDHHKSARDDLLSEDEDTKNYFFDMNKSGARLAWEFFWPDKEVPLLIRYIEDKDLWRFSLPKSREFSAFWVTIPFQFELYDQYVKDESLIEKAIESGTIILNYVQNRVSFIKDKDMFKRKMTVNIIDDDKKPQIKNYTVFVTNAPLWQSDLGNSLANIDGSDFGMVFSYDGTLKRYNVSLRSTNEKADVSQVAKAFGGGGHRNASGFVWDKPIEDLFDSEEQ